MSFDEIEICNEITGNLKYILELEKQFKDKVDSVKEEILKRLKTLWELESIFHYSQDLICIIGEDLNFKKINPAFTKVLGYTEEELLGKPFIDYIHPEDRVKTLEASQNLKGNGKTGRLLTRCLCKDGSFRWLEWDVVANNNKNLFFGIARDVTEVIKSRRDTQILSSIVAESYDAIIGNDIDGNIICWNSAAEKIFGYSREEALGHHISIILPENYCFDEAKEAIAHETIKAFRTQRRRKNGDLVNVAVTISPLKDDRGEVVGIASIYRDITEKIKYEQEFRRLERLNIIGQMAAGIAHEIKNPMTIIRGFLQLLQKKENLEEKETFSLIINELDRVNQIISEFLSVARNRPIDFQKENLNDLIQRILPLLKSNAVLNDKSIKVKLGDIPLININAAEIRQLIINMVNNGLEAMAPGGVVEIETNPGKKGSVILAVRDQGKGIPSEVLEKIGTPFVTTKDNGTGLGLAICYQIAARHGADIKVNTGPTGTEFIIEFPAEIP